MTIVVGGRAYEDMLKDNDAKEERKYFHEDKNRKSIWQSFRQECVDVVVFAGGGKNEILFSNTSLVRWSNKTHRPAFGRITLVVKNVLITSACEDFRIAKTAKNKIISSCRKISFILLVLLFRKVSPLNCFQHKDPNKFVYSGPRAHR